MRANVSGNKKCKRKVTIYEKYVKRPLDFLCALFAIIVLSPVMLAIAFLVRIKLGSPVIFKQKRPGLNEKIFTMYKFRTMTDEKDENGKLLPDEVRLTKFGNMLRHTSLDELPELVNILKGDMSVVGPRPQLVCDMVFMTPEQRMRHIVRPGLTGLAQTKGRNALSWNRKLEIDLQYIETIAFSADIKIIITTVKQVFLKKKGIEGGTVDEIDITDDFGDYLLKAGRISDEEYKQKMYEAKALFRRCENGKI